MCRRVLHLTTKIPNTQLSVGNAHSRYIHTNGALWQQETSDILFLKKLEMNT